jgi:hypothetical protein
MKFKIYLDIDRGLIYYSMSKINNTKTEMNNSSQSLKEKTLLNNILLSVEELNEKERNEYKKYLINDCSFEEEWFDEINYIHSQIGDGIYDIISFIQSDKEISNWVRYGYGVNFKRDEKVMRKYSPYIFEEYDKLKK